MLKWDEAEIGELLRVKSSVIEDGYGYRFEYRKDGFILSLAVFPGNQDVIVELFSIRGGQPLFTDSLIPCSRIRCVTERDVRKIKITQVHECVHGCAMEKTLEIVVEPELTLRIL